MKTPTDIRPPRMARKALQWFCDPALLEDVEGDLAELFQYRASKNLRRARWLYVRDVLQLFRPGIIKKSNWFNPVNNINMLLNHVKTAIRQAQKYKGYTAINVAGLVVGLASCMLILLWIADESAKDKFHEKSDRIYQVWRNMVQDDGSINTTNGIPYPLEHVLRTEYPEIESVTSYTWEMEHLFRVGDNSSYEKGRFATPGFFDVFSFPMIVGDPRKALIEKPTMVISDRMALKFFGNDWRDKVLGQSMKVDERLDMQITGVFETPRNNSSLQFDWLVAGQGFIDRNEWVQSWGNGAFSMFFALRPGADTEAVRSRIEKEIIKHTEGTNEPLFIQRFADHYLHGTFENGVPTGGRIQYVRILSVIAVFILLLACINFMNLSTARASLRAREIGVRKVMGAFRSTLSQQFFTEAALHAASATALAALLALLLLPYFNTLTGKFIQVDFREPIIWLTLAGIVLLTGALSGIYPALMLSSFSAAKSLKGRNRQSHGNLFRQGLVTFQFAISMFLISGTIIISNQLKFILNKDIGLDRENVMSVELIGDLIDKKEVYLNTLRSVPEVTDATMSSGSPINVQSSTSGAKWPGKDPNAVIEINVLSVSVDFIKTMGMEIVRGEDFSNSYKQDSARFLINEVLAKMMGFDDPVGQQLSLWGTNGTIAGVVKNFHMASMYSPISPVIIRYQPAAGDIAFIRVKGNMHEAVASIERVTKEVNPAFPFRYDFLDQDFARQYQAEQSVSSLVTIFAGVSVFIACLGLLGLSSFSADQRAKEIGIRKVHGATTGSLVVLLSTHYAKLMLLAFIVAVPVSYVYMNRWLAHFAYRTDLNPMFFLIAGVVTFAMGALTVSYKSYKAALANPANTLKEE